MAQCCKYFLLVLAGMGLEWSASADSLTDRLEHLKPGVHQLFSLPVERWRFHLPDVAGGQQTNLDDSAWSEVAAGFSWTGANTRAWFRTTATMPAMIGGEPVNGRPVRLELGMDDDGELYVNGQLKEAFHWDEGRYTLMDKARPGQVIQLAVRGINGPGDGQFHFARLVCDGLPEFDQYVDGLNFATMLLERLPATQQTMLRTAVNTSESEIHFTRVTADNLATVRAELTRAQADLAPLAGLARKYDVYYVGHAHIDMNWLWPWSETIDVCQRTWNTALNLMDEFPEFQFVQSQAGAYVPIEAGFPRQFARMQQKAASGQWDPVGGMWNESDTDIPSGEGLARSFLLGQAYFKEKFGRYATTGWLPDSFGHTRQLPQILQLAGLRNFYHVRCGNDMPFVWWEAPDGSRVLKANTGDYDANAELRQLVAPAEIDARFQLPQSLTVFGVGDHGGGPTREQILRIKAFQDDPRLPRVHFASADAFFAQLAQQPATAALPVVATDLQYTFPGCYTTHADLKKALRGSENNLYTAEVLSSLAAMEGQPYQIAAFRKAWQPTAFAQFHDIACGSAIHSTYDWMHEQLAPAMRFAREQSDKSLQFLTARADTRGPGTTAITVWNTLATERDDVVMVPLAGAEQYHSVLDQQSRRFPAQATEGGLAFIARQVPALGHSVYFLDTNACPADGVTLQDAGPAYEIETPRLTLQISKTTGALARLFDKVAQWNVFGQAGDGNALQLLGDNGSAWDINYTGDNKIFTMEEARVEVMEQGPVFVRLRVTHAAGRTLYTQDLVVYGALPRVDIPTTINWQEEHQLLKIRLPVDAEHAEVTAQIPFGSIVRPTNGQECPGQKWMDVSDAAPTAVTGATPLDLSAQYNSQATDNLDGSGNAYPQELLPTADLKTLGDMLVPFRLTATAIRQPDHVVAAGQRFKLPTPVTGDTLYLLAASINGSHWTDIGFQLADGQTEFRAFALNDWVVNEFPDNVAGLTFAYRHTSGGRDQWSPKMWIVHVPVPVGATGLILPNDDRFHLFAATLATRHESQPLHGLSILNDSKYGFDVVSNVFRLTALRSSSNPDPHPDQGRQHFTYSLYPHAGGWQSAQTEAAALALNLPLLPVVTTVHPPLGQLPVVVLQNIGNQGGLVVTAFKQSEDGQGYILRFYESEGKATQARIAWDKLARVEVVDLLERPMSHPPITVQDHAATLPVGHNQIVSLHLLANSTKVNSL